MKNFIVAMAVVFALFGCYRPDQAKEVLGKQGFTNIETHGWSPFGCGEEDTFTTKFSATSPIGEHVTGVVCSGFFKGATVRFD